MSQFSKTSALSVIHKYIRLELFSVGGLLARALPGDCPMALQRITEVAALLRGHGAQEDSLLLPRLRAINPALANHMADDHRHLEEHLHKLLVLAEDLEASQPESCRALLAQLHLDWMKFVGDYLLHLDDEERLLFPALGELAPVEIVAQSAAAQAPAERTDFLRKLANALNPDEFRQISDAVASMAREELRETATTME